jgi:nucleotide-binding universal stress UspA family protein
MPRIRRIIAGVSGSSRGLPALRWAADLARVYRAELYPVHAWLPPGGAWSGYQFPSEHLWREWEEAAWQRLGDTLELAFGGYPPGLGLAASDRSAACGTAGSAGTAWLTPAAR